MSDFDIRASRSLATVYVFLRTRTALEFADHAFAAFYEAWSEPVEIFAVGSERESWDNGIVLRVATMKTPATLAVDLAKGLEEFDAWAIHDGCGRFAESSSQGLLRRYFESVRAAGNAGDRFAQIFVMMRSYDRNYEATIDQIRSAFRARCLPAFHFNNGQIMFVDSSEGGGIANRRCQPLVQKLRAWAVVDSNGCSFSADREDEGMWDFVDRVTFGDLND